MNDMVVILAFLKAYKEWVEAGVPNHPYFDPAHGLCTNLKLYALYERYFTGSRLISIRDSLCSLFEEDGLSTILPFNLPMFNQPHYMCEFHHKKWRIKWVNDTITKLEGKFK